MFSQSTWRGTREIEADRIALRDDEGVPQDVRDLFVGADAVAITRVVEAPVGPGLPNAAQLTWDDEAGTPPTDAQVPGLASLLAFLEQERPPRHVHVTTQRHYRPTDENWTFLTRRLLATRTQRTATVLVETPSLSRRGVQGKPGRNGRAHVLSDSAISATRAARILSNTECSPVVYASRQGPAGARGREGRAAALPETHVERTRVVSTTT